MTIRIKVDAMIASLCLDSAALGRLEAFLNVQLSVGMESEQVLSYVTTRINQAALLTVSLIQDSFVREKSEKNQDAWQYVEMEFAQEMRSVIMGGK